MSFKDLINSIKGDLMTEKELGLKFIIHAYMFNSSFRLLLNYRIGKFWYSKNLLMCRLIAMRYKIRQLKKRNCQISFSAEIGKGVKFPHPLGIVIGDRVVIKDNVKIWQQVTFGSHGRQGESPCYPKIENNVRIFAGAKLFGDITIGENAIIGANAVVLNNVPENCIAVGVPARIIQPQKK